MFDPIGVFTRQFTPVEGGYLYYPSRKAGGKLVTHDEYERLVTDWQRVAGRRGQWKVAGVAFGFILLWAIATQALALPDWTEWMMIAFCVSSISGWFLWTGSAPRRLVSGRPDITPPRPSSEARREARALLNWRFVIFALLFSGVALFGTLSSPDQTLSWWAWLFGSGTLFGAYVWIALQKVMDWQR